MFRFTVRTGNNVTSLYLVDMRLLSARQELNFLIVIKIDLMLPTLGISLYSCF